MGVKKLSKVPALQHSRYNFFVQHEKGVVGYNARTGTFALLSASNAKILQNGSNPENLTDGKMLRRNGFIHAGNEVALVKQKFRNSRKPEKQLHITLIPTLACNISCDYCFQAAFRTSEVMSRKVELQTLKYIKSALSLGVKQVLITWFGGEPLIRKNRIIALTKEIKTVVKKAKGTLDITMVTNGLLLDVDAAKKMNQLGMKNVQVCFDCHQEEAGWRGMYKSNGQPSDIYQNVLQAKQHLDVQIRINVTSKNAADIQMMVDDLYKNGLKTVVLSHIYDYEKETGCITKKDGTRISVGEHEGHGCSLTRDDYAKLENITFWQKDESLQLLIRKLTPKPAACAASANRMVVISPDGSISRCWHSAGVKKESAANIKDGFMPPSAGGSAIDKKWAGYMPFDNPKCKECNVLPLCMGGCAHPRLFMEADLTPCDPIRYNIEQCVAKVANAIDITEEDINSLA